MRCQYSTAVYIADTPVTAECPAPAEFSVQCESDPRNLRQACVAHVGSLIPPDRGINAVWRLPRGDEP